MAITATQVTVTALASGANQNGTVVFPTQSTSNAITSIIACNNSASTLTFSLYAVPSGKTAYANPETVIVSNLSLPPGETLSLDQEKLVLGASDLLGATASSAYSGTGIGIVVSSLPV
jgi:hypothetical protein